MTYAPGTFHSAQKSQPDIQSLSQAASFSAHLPLVNFLYLRLMTDGTEGPILQENQEGTERLPNSQPPLSWFTAVSRWARPQSTAEPTQVACSLLPSPGSWMKAEFDFLILPSSQQKEKCSPGTWPGFCTQAERGPAKAGHRKAATPRSPEAALGTKKRGCSHPFTYKLPEALNDFPHSASLYLLCQVRQIRFGGLVPTKR